MAFALYFPERAAFDIRRPALKWGFLIHLLFAYVLAVVVRPAANDASGGGTAAFVKRFDSRLAAFSDKLFNEKIKSMGQDIKLYLHAQPMVGMHFDNRFLVDTPKGEKAYLYIFPLVGFFILLIVDLSYGCHAG